MTFGLQVFDASGALAWDSTSVVGGVIVDSREYGISATAALTYPVFAGRTPVLLNVIDVNPPSVTVDVSLGYPRVTVVSAGQLRRFLLAVY